MDSSNPLEKVSEFWLFVIFYFCQFLVLLGYLYMITRIACKEATKSVTRSVSEHKGETINKYCE